MIITYEDVNPTLIPNTTMKKMFIDGAAKTYHIMPNDGYVLHDKLLDEYASYDDEGNGIGELTLYYYPGMRTIAVWYDFEENPREFYAVPESNEKGDETIETA